MVKYIGFLSNKLTLRGTEIAMYDYADYNETMLNNKSLIISRDYNLIKHVFDVSEEAYTKFKKRFTVEYYNSQKDIDNIVEKYNLTHLYIIKHGPHDGIITTKCKNLIHCIFNSKYEHGEIYSVISKNVNDNCETNYPIVPHMIRVNDTDENLRSILKIPENSIVFGRYGGKETFDIDFVKQCIKNILNEREDIFFIFLNTDVFLKNDKIIYLDGTTDMEFKRKFINTCDAMIHARKGGETFGLACGEFAVCEKPIITFRSEREINHIDILKEKAIIYNNYNELYEIINTFHKNKYDMKNNGYMEYNAENIMKIFNQVYLM
jgi:hypothetical protein